MGTIRVSAALITQKIQARIFAGNPPALALHGFTYARYFAEHTPIVPLQQFIDKDREFDRGTFRMRCSVWGDSEARSRRFRSP